MSIIFAMYFFGASVMNISANIATRNQSYFEIHYYEKINKNVYYGGNH